MQLTFYTRPDCELCTEAELMLRLIKEDYPIEWSTVNIEEDDEIHEKYMLMIPVLEHKGEVVLYGNIGYVDLLELVENNKM